MDTRLLIRLTPALVVGALVAWLVAVLIGQSAASVTATIVLRTLLIAVVLLLVVRYVVRRAYAGPAVSRRIAVAAVASYALSPSTWAGRSLAGQLVVDPGPASAAIDLVLWVLVVVVAGRSVEPRPEPSPYQPYQLPTG